MRIVHEYEISGRPPQVSQVFHGDRRLLIDPRYVFSFEGIEIARVFERPPPQCDWCIFLKIVFGLQTNQARISKMFHKT